MRTAQANSSPCPGRRSPSDERICGRVRTWVALVLVAISCIAFLPGLYNGFVNFDDDTNILTNTEFQGFGWRHWRWAIGTERLGVYQPLAWILFEAEFSIFGLHPAGYHFTSVVFHVANSVLLYVLTLALLGRVHPRHSKCMGARAALLAGIAVALFAAHPLRVEAVAWASAQPYLPCGGFALLSVLAYLAAHPTGAKAKSGCLVASIVFFAMSLACKAASVGLPLVLAILDVYPLRRLSTGRVLSRTFAQVAMEKTPFMVLSLATILVALHAREQSRSLEAVPDSSLASRLTQACYSALFYPAKSLVPSELTAYYPLPNRLDWREKQFLAAISLTVVITTVFVLWRNTYPGMLAAWFAYLAILGPQLGLVRTGPQLVADRYGYLAMMAWTTPVASALIGMVAATRLRGSRLVLAATVAAGLGAVVALGLLSNRQLRIWHDSLTLWAHVERHGGGAAPWCRSIAHWPWWVRAGLTRHASCFPGRLSSIRTNARPRTISGGYSWRRAESPKQSRDSKPPFAFSPTIRRQETTGVWPLPCRASTAKRLRNTTRHCDFFLTISMPTETWLPHSCTSANQTLPSSIWPPPFDSGRPRSKCVKGSTKLVAVREAACFLRRFDARARVKPDPIVLI